MVANGVENVIESRLYILDTDYIDLLLLHQQYGEYIDAYKAMEKAVEFGKVKSIGLSNFNEERFEDVINKCTIEDLEKMRKLDTGTRFFTMSEEEQERAFTGFAPDFNNQK